MNERPQPAIFRVLAWLRIRLLGGSAVRREWESSATAASLRREQKAFDASQAHYDKLLKLDTRRRERYLKKLQRRRPDEYAEVLSLLKYEQPGSAEFFTPSEGSGSPALKAGDMLGRYEIVRYVGRGGMGEVYEASHPDLGKRALKILKQKLAEDPEFIRRFRHEARATASLIHPNILTVHDFGREGHFHFYVSEFVEGEDFRRRIGRCPPEEALSVLRQVAEAMQFAHARGFLHRDIKPENIMVQPDGHIKLLDFGLTKAIQSETAGEPRQPAPGAVTESLPMGTLPYVSPEQMSGGAVGRPSDIWSWAVVMYEALAGVTPFPAGPGFENAVREDEPGPPCGNRSLNRVVRRALRKKAADRYQSFDEVLARLPDLYRRRIVRRIAMSVAILATAALLAYPLLRRDIAVYEVGRQLTFRDNVTHVAVSPGGLYYAYTTSDDTLRIREAETTSDFLVANLGKLSASDVAEGITYSPDGGFIYLTAQDSEDGNVSKLYRIVPKAGAALEFVAANVDSPISFAPDGRQYVFLRNVTNSLVVGTVGGGDEKVWPELSPTDSLTPYPSWSPDNIIACAVSQDSGRSGLIELGWINGKLEIVKRTQVEPWVWIGRPTWPRPPHFWLRWPGVPLGHTPILLPAMPFNSNHQRLLGSSSIRGSFARAVQSESAFPEISASPDRSTMAAVKSDRHSRITVVRLGSREPEDVPGSEAAYFGVAWISDKSLISQTAVDSNPDFYAIDSRGGSRERLTNSPDAKQDAVVSPDRKYLVYSWAHESGFNIYRQDLCKDCGDKPPVRLTKGERDEQPSISPDGKWVIYTARVGRSNSLYIVPLAGGDSEPFGDYAARRASFSPDGRSLVAEVSDNQSGWRVAIIDFISRKPIYPEQIAPSYAVDKKGSLPVRWSPDGRELWFVKTDSDVSNVWAQKINGGRPGQLTHFQQDRIFAFAPSPDGRSIACIRGKRISNVWLLSQTR